jgi:hypothetical protein
MSAAQIFKDAIVAPVRGLAAAADSKSAVQPLVAATLASLLFASALVPRIDYERTVQERLDENPEAAQQMSPNDREVALARAQKLGGVFTYGAALFGPTMRALAVASCLLLALRVAGAKAPFSNTFAAASFGLLPLALKDLLSLPALLRMHGIAARESDRALPSSLAALLPPGIDGPFAGLAQALDLFSLWSLALVTLGTAHAAGVSRRRAFAVVFVLWAAYVLLSYVARPGFTGVRPI